MKQFILTAIFTSLLFTVFSQTLDNYTIKGRIKSVDTGKVFLVPVIFDEKYYGENFSMDSAIIKGGDFKIHRKATDNYTYAYRLVVRSPIENGATDFIFISGKDVFVEIDSIDEHIAPRISASLVQNEMTTAYNPFFKDLVNRVQYFYDEVEEMYIQFDNHLPKEKMLEIENTKRQFRKQSDSLFMVYASNHPTSQVTLWKMIERLENVGYHNAYKDIFNGLPDDIKNSNIGQSLNADLMEMETLGIGKVFPTIQLENTLGEFSIVDTSVLGKSFTLIDFWFTDCSPCRAQFPEFKSLFNTYRTKGFQIIGISIDGPSKYDAWKNLIKNDQLNLVQFLDKQGVTTEKIGVNSFPTNFLLDSNGVILQKNITLSALGSLLMENDAKKNVGER